MSERTPSSEHVSSKDDNSQGKQPGQHGQHALSCTHCRQRKVKCNKVWPCLPCQRSNFECVFPERAKHPKRKKTGASRSSTTELLDRLGRMEKLIATMDNDGHRSAMSDSKTGTPKQASTPPWLPGDQPPSRKSSLKDVGFGDKDRDGSASPSDGLNRYIGGSFWRNLTSEVEGLRQAIDEDEYEDDHSSPYSTTADSQSSHSAIMFNSAFNTPQKLRGLHPPPAHINTLAEIFISNVDPVCKFLHVPSLRKFIANSVSDLDHIPTDNYVEPLLFTIYYAATTSLTNEQCLLQFHDGRDSLLAKFRAGVERALANADFLNSSELGIIQALGLFNLTVRTNDDSQFSWTLFATAVRLAHGIGLHRESMFAGLTPFAIEMRRRCWWQLVVLDIRNCEDRASEPIISPTSFNTRKPLNINDEDISPESSSFPPERVGYTELTKSSVSHEVSYLRWRFGELPHFEGENEIDMKLPLEERVAYVKELEDSLTNRVLRYCDPAVPIAWVTAVVTRLIMCRLRLILYHPIDVNGARFKEDRLQISNEKLLETAVACIEYAHLLDSEPKASQWRWFFKTYVQWHALATTLAELCIQTKGPLVDRSWHIVDAVYDDWGARVADSPNGMLWRPMKKLLAKACSKRAEALQLDQKMNSTSAAQHPLPRFDSLSFDPQPLPGQQNGSSLSPETKNLTPFETVKQYGVPCMPPFDGQVNVANLAGKNDALDGVDQLLNDATAFGGINGGQQIPGTILGVATPPQDTSIPFQDLPSNILDDGQAGAGEINWAEWDEFVSGFDMPMKDISMANVQDNMKSEGRPLDIWW